MRLIRFIRGSGSFKWYYRFLNEFLRMVYGRNMMLHFPFYRDEVESFEQRQINLVDHCLNEFDEISEKKLLEVGCGNGANCQYISNRHPDAEIIGIDLNSDNLEIAVQHHSSDRISFMLDDAQKLEQIEDNSVDLLICIESAFHYPDKHAFFSQIKRVLRPEGKFVVADILRRSEDPGRSLWWWKKSMQVHNAREESYLSYASGNQLAFVKSEDITEGIIKGYEGHTSWISRHERSWTSFLLLRLTLFIIVRLYLKELRKHKRYMMFTGVHA